jgi:hypothetical protein
LRRRIEKPHPSSDTEHARAAAPRWSCIVVEAFGPGLLDDPAFGEARITMCPVGPVRYGTGPHSRSNIYLTGYSEDEERGICVFNRPMLSVRDFHPIEGIENIHDIGLSLDET